MRRTKYVSCKSYYSRIDKGKTLWFLIGYSGCAPKGGGGCGTAAALKGGPTGAFSRRRDTPPTPESLHRTQTTAPLAPHCGHHRTHVTATLLFFAVTTFYGGRTGRATAQGGEKSTTPRRGTDLGLSFYGSSQKRAPYAAAAAPAPTPHKKFKSCRRGLRAAHVLGWAGTF